MPRFTQRYALRSMPSAELIGHRRSSRNARSTHRFDPLSPRRPWLERIAKVLGLAGYLPIFELHYAHRVRRLPIVSEDEFSDPQVGSTEDPPYSEALFVWLRETRCLNVAPTADALSRLRILEDCILSINLVLLVEVICVRGSPVSIQRCANILVFHRSPPRGSDTDKNRHRIAIIRTSRPRL